MGASCKLEAERDGLGEHKERAADIDAGNRRNGMTEHVKMRNDAQEWLDPRFLRSRDSRLDLDRAVTSLATYVLQLIEEHRAVVKQLWLGHHRTTIPLYGDDGEMQCSACMIDFRHFPIADAIKRMFMKRHELANERDALRAQVETLTLRRDETVAMCSQLRSEVDGAQLCARNWELAYDKEAKTHHHYAERVRLLEEALRGVEIFLRPERYLQADMSILNLLQDIRAALTPEKVDAD